MTALIINLIMNLKIILFVHCLISVCLCDINIDRKEKLLNGFIVYYNNLPNQTYTCDEGVLQNAQQTDDKTFRIEVNLKVSEINNIDAIRFLTCTATVQDLQENGITVIDNDLKCEERQKVEENIATIDHPTDGKVAVTEPTVERRPVQLDNEIQGNTGVTSGEQFIAIPRERPSTPCVGCSSHVNPQAVGVSDLASLGVRHLNKHEPNVRHSLDTIVDVERQVQVVNGVRYILTLFVNFNNCTDTETEACASARACKISVLVKPWIKLPNGSKYRAVIGNNCTEEWHYGDNGEVLPEDSDDNRAHNQIDSHPSKDDSNDEIKVIHNADVQSKPNQEKILTNEEVKDIEEQIIPKNQFQTVPHNSKEHEVITDTPDLEVSKQHVLKDESVRHNENSLPSIDSEKSDHTSTLNQDKKQAIDDMLDFFNFAGFKPHTETDDAKPRMKRNYDYDLQVLALAENYRNIKKRLENAKFVYNLAQVMVEYMNEMDITVKDRVLKNVLNAEEEFENFHHFVYIQAIVGIPCDKTDCKPDDKTNKICNGVIDSTNEDNPMVLNAFCYNDNKEKPEDTGREVPVDDPVLQNLIKSTIKKIDSESSGVHAIRLNKVVSANTQQASGTLTKMSILVDYINCNKSVPYALKKNCTVLEQLGSSICEVIILERHWLKEKKITYTCTDIPIDVSMSKEKQMDKANTTSDRQILDMLREALQHLEEQSNRNNKQKIVKINSVSSQIIAGFLTKIEFMVGYTTCSNEYVVSHPSRTCELLPNEPLRKCLAQFWDRSWIEDGRQIEVACDEDINKSDDDSKKTSAASNTEKARQKRSLDFVGGQSERNVDYPQYKALALESLQEFMKTSSGQQHYDMVTIDKVTVQVVSGKLTRIDFTISPTNCQLNSDRVPSSTKCKIVNSENTYKCTSKILEQVWLDNKQINVTCRINDGHSISKRANVGGLKEQDPKDPEYINLAEKSLQQYIATIDGGDTQSFKLVRVENVTTQVVAGSLTRLNFAVSSPKNMDNINCYSEIWERPWLNKTNIKVRCNINDEKISRSKRHSVGGLTEQDPSAPKYKALAEDSLRKYVQTTGTSQPLTVIRVEKVTTQVVSGSLTNIDFVIGESEESEHFTCHSKIWEQPWRNKKDIKVICKAKTSRTKRGVPGGKVEQNADDPKYFKLAEECLQKYVADSGSTDSHKVIRVTEVLTQVVAGLKTYIDFKVSQSDNGDIITCQADIWEQAWLKKKEINVHCNIDGQNKARAKRDTKIVGGLKEQNANDSEYLKLAEECLQKYLGDSGNKNSHKVIRVTKVSTQVVAGLKTNIKFEMSPLDNDDIKICQAEVWEQAWLQKKEINVNCNINDNNSRPKRHILRNKKTSSKTFGGKNIQDPTNQQFKLLAEESLRKYERLMDNGISHKVVEVKHVETQLVSGMLYMIDYTATPTTCSASVSKVDCSNENVIVYCHTRIWSQPWMHSKKIDVSCFSNEESDEEDDDDNNDDIDDARVHDWKPQSTPSSMSLLGAPEAKNVKEPRFMVLAEESLSKYLTTSNKKNVHRIIEIHSASEQVVEGIKTQLLYSVSPTKCLLNETIESVNDCEIIKPQIVLRCTAEIWDRPWLHAKDITVSCKKRNTYEKTVKHINNIRGKREVENDDDYVDEEMSYYYANRALQHVNEKSMGGHLHKLVTIHAVQYSTQMKTTMVRMYIELAETFCLRHKDEMDLPNCEELDGLNHRLCLARIWPSPDDELVVRHVTVICDDEDDFESISGLYISNLLVMSINEYEKNPEVKFKTVHQGEPHIIPSLDSKIPIIINFLLATTNCSKNVNLTNSLFACYIDVSLPSKTCTSYIWLMPNGKSIKTMTVSCSSPTSRTKRSASDPTNTTTDDREIQKLVTAALEKLEMQSLHRYKQRVLQINSHSSKITSGKVTTIDFDVGYTSCLKYEWVENVTSCDFVEHLPRRHCVAQIWERLWLNNGRNIDVRCEDDETPLEAHIEFESAEMAMELAQAALKHIEAKYPHPRKQKVVRIFSLEKQVIAGIHYRMKIEVGLTDCMALSAQEDCKLVKLDVNKFCRVNVWIRPWTDHPPNYRVSCDYQDGATTDLYRNIQAEHLFYDFVTTYNPYYINDHNEMRKRFDIFKENVRKIHELNIYEKGTARYGVTRFTDLTYDEFRAKYTGLKPSLRNPNNIPMSQAYIPKMKIPENFDWREYDAVTEVKDQGSCGSCWAFSVTGNIEGQWKMQSGSLVSLSEQELVDCDKLDEGCNGGLPDNAYRAIEELGGLEAESDYPYEAEDDKCAFNKTLTKVRISGAVNISSNETDMATWLLHNGPISIGINANAMQFYMGGISHPWKMLCSPSNLDHGVLLVGYGIKDYPLFNKRLPYWIVKNSWGKSWGEQGYYRVFRGDGTCGVNQMASSAVI